MKTIHIKGYIEPVTLLGIIHILEGDINGHISFPWERDTLLITAKNLKCLV